MTGDESQRQAADSEASLRENLAEQLTSAQSELSTSLIELRRSAGADPGLITQADTQLATLMALKGQLAGANSQRLASIQAQITVCVAASSSLAQQAQAAITGGDTRAAAIELAHSSEAARSAVNDFTRDFYERRIFDPYLKFSSDEDQEAYRKREADRQKQIADAQALNAPAGNLRAAQIAQEQLRDAGAHGADQSPDFKPMVTKLEERSDDLQRETDRSSREPKATAKAVAPSDHLAALKAAGVTVADSGSGHGVTARDPRGTEAVRG